MKCLNCGYEFIASTIKCPECGVYQTNGDGKIGLKPSELEDSPNIAVNILGFIIPLFGFIMYLLWRKESPVRAKSCLLWSTISFALYIFVHFIMFLFKLFIALT